MKCDICGSKFIKKIHRLKNTVYRCEECGVYFCKDAKFDSAFESSINEKQREIGIKDLRMENFKQLCNKLKRYIKDDSIGLEVGCAYGWFLEEINADLNTVCYGIEPEKAVIPKLENKKYKIYEGFFPDDLPSENKKYDYIVFNDVFEHLPNCQNIMDGCKKLLNDDGYIIINLPLSTGIFYKIASIFNKFGRSKELNRLWQFDFHSPHLYYFNKKSIGILAQKNGFEIEDFFKLETLDSKNIYSRIATDKFEKFVRLKAHLLRLSLPIINRMSPDIGVFILKKTDYTK